MSVPHMVLSPNFNQSYYGVEYTILPSLVEIEGGEGVRINQNTSKIGQKWVENRSKSDVSLTAHISKTAKATENLI